MKIIVISANCGCKGKLIEKDKIINNIKEAMVKAEVVAEVFDTNSFDDMIKYGLMTTPAVVINGNVRFAGRIPKVEELIEEIKKADS